MYKLKKIIDVEFRRSCFCGRELVNNLCEAHGPDIKISTTYIHAQFESIPKADKKTKTKLISVSLTENQFIRLFPKKNLENLIPIKQDFIVDLSQYGSSMNNDTIIDDYLNLLEYDLFMNKMRMKETSLTKSGICANFLFCVDKLEPKKWKFTFNVVLLRNLKDYLFWRKKQFNAKMDSIIKTLTRTRSNVIDSNGKDYTIKDISLKNGDEINTITCTTSNENKEAIFNKINTLYHNKDNFFISSRLERKIYSALSSFSQSMMNSLKQYCASQSCLAEIKRAKLNHSNLYNHLIGSKIKEINQIPELDDSARTET